jgi:hypothetical protein
LESSSSLSLPISDYRPERKGYGTAEVFFGFGFSGNGALEGMRNLKNLWEVRKAGLMFHAGGAKKGKTKEC